MRYPGNALRTCLGTVSAVSAVAAFAFPAEAGTHVLTPEGWKAELVLGGFGCKHPEVSLLN